jgi:hypothetical protein
MSHLKLHRTRRPSSKRADWSVVGNSVSQTKTCQECIDLLADYVDGALPAEVTSKLEEHMGDCQPCEDFLATYRSTTSVCRRVMARAMPDAIATKLRDFLRSEIGKDNQAGGH